MSENAQVTTELAEQFAAGALQLESLDLAGLLRLQKEMALANANGGARRVGARSPGEHDAQGDVNFIAVDWDDPRFQEYLRKEYVEAPWVGSTQIVSGTTKGARHEVHPDDAPHVRRFVRKTPHPLHTVILYFEKDGRVVHPEHGDYYYDGGSCIVVIQQRDKGEILRARAD